MNANRFTETFNYTGWTPLHYLITLAAPAFADIISLMMNRTTGRSYLQSYHGDKDTCVSHARHAGCYIMKAEAISRLLEILERLVAHRLMCHDQYPISSHGKTKLRAELVPKCESAMYSDTAKSCYLLHSTR